MNLCERFNIVKDNMSGTEIVTEKEAFNNNIIVKNVNVLRTALSNLNSINIFSDIIKDISNSTNLLISGGDDLAFSKENFKILEQKINKLRCKAEDIIAFYAEDLPDSKDDALQIKLPPSTSSFDELSKIANLLKTAFELPVHSIGNDGGKVEIISASPGSVWLIVKFGTAFSLITLILKGVAKIKEERQKAKANEVFLKQIGTSQEHLEKVQHLVEKQLKIIFDEQASEIARGTTKATDPDDPLPIFGHGKLDIRASFLVHFNYLLGCHSV